MSDRIDWVEKRKQVKMFIEGVVYPLEGGFDKDTPESQAGLKAVQQKAKDAGLWALGHPKDVGGQGMPFMDYVHVNEVIGRSQWARIPSRILLCCTSTPRLNGAEIT